MSDYIVGLTGGIGSGKSTVASAFAALGITVVDADDIAREVVLPGSAALAAITARFGADCLLADGSLDRAALRRIVFREPAERQWLEQLLHPLIRQRLQALLAAASSPYALLVSPLLLETNQRQLCQRVIVVDVPESVQLERASRRDNSNRADIERIMAAQMPRQQRLAQADAVIDNSGANSDIATAVEPVHRQLLQWATAQRNQQQ